MAWSFSWPRATGLPTASVPRPPPDLLEKTTRAGWFENWEFRLTLTLTGDTARHLPTAPHPTPGPCQRGTRDEPWVTLFWRLAEDTASVQKEGGPQKELVSQGEAGTPAPPESADPVPSDPTLTPPTYCHS